MRMLVVSNFYPPHHIGGHELACSEAVQALGERGHQVKVLTSSYGLARPETDGHVYRWLETDIGRSVSTRRLFQREWHNRAAFRRLVRRDSA